MFFADPNYAREGSEAREGGREGGRGGVGGREGGRREGRSEGWRVESWE